MSSPLMASAAPARLPALGSRGLFGAALLLGLCLRGWHYLANPSVWHDEAALALNVLGKSFHDLLGPLYFAEAAPPLFLWAEKSISHFLGDGLGTIGEPLRFSGNGRNQRAAGEQRYHDLFHNQR